MTKSTEYLKFEAPDGKDIIFPVATVIGENDGPHFVITAGIHGAEYPAIAAAIKLFKELDPKEINGKVTIVTISSVVAFEARSMFVNPIDQKNPNRVFAGKLDGTYTDALAYYLFTEIISKGDYYIDLHGGDMVEALEPFSIYHIGAGEEVDRKSKEIAEYYALPNIVATSSDGSWSDAGTTYANASKKNVPGAIVEVGGIGQLDQESVDMHIKGMKNVLRHFKCLKGNAFKPQDIKFYDDFVWVNSPAKGIFYCFVEVSDVVQKDQKIGVVEDYFGNHLADVFAPVGGRVLFLTTSPAMADKGLLMGIGVK